MRLVEIILSIALAAAFSSVATMFFKPLSKNFQEYRTKSSILQRDIFLSYSFKTCENMDEWMESSQKLFNLKKISVERLHWENPRYFRTVWSDGEREIEVIKKIEGNNDAK